MPYELYSNNFLNYVPCKVKNDEFSTIQCEKITTKLTNWKDAIYWNIATLGKTKAYIVYDGETIIHSSYVVRGDEKFAFLGKNDIEIGPCWTHPDYRGLGIYPAVLSHIISEELSGGGYCIYDYFRHKSGEPTRSREGWV